MCQCKFVTHGKKPCANEPSAECIDCGTELCDGCTLDGLHCARCYRQHFSQEPRQIGGQLRKNPQWRWQGG